jgi:hypothetical protein
MSDEFGDFPKARVSIEGGDLIDCYDAALTYSDGEKVVNTLRQNPAGSTGGPRSASLALKSAISEAGFERDFFGHYKKRKVVQARVKISGKTFVVTGRFTNPTINSNVDNFVDFGITLLGKAQEVNA